MAILNNLEIQLVIYVIVLVLLIKALSWVKRGFEK